MKQILYISLLILVGVACRKEDTLSPTTNWVNGFDVPENATDAESTLRREFMSATGCYLLFNDTLRKELIRYNEDGEAIYSVETIDLSYSISSAGRNKQSFTYLASIDQKKEAVNFVQDHLLTLMSKNLYPYSVLLVDSIFSTAFHYEQGSDESGIYGERTFVRYYSGERCLAVSTGDIGQMDEMTLKEAVNEMLIGMIQSKLNANVILLEDFWGYFEDLYGLHEEDLWDWGYYDYYEDTREFGFLRGEIKYDTYIYYAPTKEEDLADYLDAVFGNEEEFLEENEAFPVVLEKYHILKEIVKEMGFDLNKL